MYKRDGRKLKDIQYNRNVALYFYGYTYDDIAEILNNKRANVYSSLFKNNAIEEVTPKNSRVPYTFMPKEIQELLSEVQDSIQEVYLRNKKVKAVLEPDNQEPDNQEEPTIEEPDNQETDNQEPSSQDLTSNKHEETGNNDTLEGTTLQATEDNILHKDLESRLSKFKEYVSEEEGLRDELGRCILCGGKGWVMEPSLGGLRKITCPSCLGRDVVDTSGQSTEEKQVILDKLIPNPLYRKNTFDHEAFSRGVKLPLEHRGRSFDRYQEFMDEVLVGLQLKQVPSKSYYIATPDGYGKKWFAYEIIKVMVELGMKTTGILNTIELSQAIDDRDYKKLDELLDTEIIMLNLSNMTRGKYAHIIQYLTDEADRRGVPLLVFSRVEAHVFVKGDRSLMGVIYKQTAPYHYGQLQQEGLSGREFTEAYRQLVTESNESIGLENDTHNKRKR